MLTFGLALIIIGNVTFYIGWIRLQQRIAVKMSKYIHKLKVVEEENNYKRLYLSILLNLK